MSDTSQLEQKILADIAQLPIELVDADYALTRTAAEFKANQKLPYADCFAAATAGTGDVLVTSDAKDFRKIPGLHILPLPEHKG